MYDLVKAYPVKIEVPVAWGEMDAFGHVNNIVYFRYFESARIAYFDRIDYMAVMQKTGAGPILAASSCTFKYALSYPDTVTAAARVSNLQDDRFTMEYLVVSQGAERVAAVGQGEIVSYDYQRKCKTSLPVEIRQRVEVLESGTQKNQADSLAKTE